MNFINSFNPKLYISNQLYIEMMSYALSTDLEMTMILSIDKETEEKYRITKINIPPQFNSGAETKTLDEEYPQWCFEQVKNNIALNGHLHTHPLFSVSPSGYDDNFFKDLIKQTNTFQFRLILNHKGNIRVDIIDALHNYYETDIGLYIEYDNLTIFTNSTTPSITNIIVDPNIKYVPTPRKYTTHESPYNRVFDNNIFGEEDYNIFGFQDNKNILNTPNKIESSEKETDYSYDDYINDFYESLEKEEKLYLAQLINDEFKENK